MVIIESPAKASSLKSYLGDDYEIMASYGHIRDLYKKSLAVNIEDGFKPRFSIPMDKRKTVAALKKAAAKFDTIYLAGDPDREGEAICWHLSQILEGDGRTFRRLRFNAITRDTVIQALKHPDALDMQLVDAQLARRVMDRLVGYKITNWLGRVIGQGKTAGRVQTVVLRIIQEREDEVTAFIPVEYWLLTGLFRQDGIEFSATLSRIDGVRSDKPATAPHSEEDAAIVVHRAREHSEVWDASAPEAKTRSLQPPPPFITSTLQQTASNRLTISPARTMKLAQELYEGIDLGKSERQGLITYMRTDSVRISADGLKECRDYLTSRFGDDALHPKPRRYRSGKGSQDAHEAIRPVSISMTPEKAKAHLTGPQATLYRLIWNRFAATQMKDCRVEKTTVTVSCAGLEFKCSGERIVEKGWSVLDPSSLKTEQPLPDLHKGKLELLNLDSEQKFTAPPPRFTEARLVTEMKKRGIGRPSTFVSTIKTLHSRKYVEKDGRVLRPTELGTTVVRLLVRMFPHMFEMDFTAKMEDLLDSIAGGSATYEEVLQLLNGPLESSLEAANRNLDEVKGELQESTEEKCPECGSPLLVRWGKFGKFLACTSFPRCKYSRPLDEDKAQAFSGRSCPDCGSDLLIRTGRFGRYLSCSRTGCKHTEPVPTGVKCPEENCGGELVEKRTRKGRTFFSCSSYPDCDFALWNTPVNTICPRCGYPLLEKRKKGTFCPRCRKKISD